MTIRTRRKLVALWLLMCFVVTLSHGGRAVSATITVDSLLDNSDASDGLCTLREALLGAGLDIALDGCAMGAGADEIVFDPALFPPPLQFGIIALTEELVLGSDSVTIAGPADAALTIIAGSDSRIVTIDQNPNAQFRLSHVLLRDGSEDIGGLVRVISGGDVIFDSVSFIDSQSTTDGGAIAIEPDAALTMEITGSHFARNDAGDDGGAIWLRADGVDIDLTISSTTFEDNTSTGYGGAMAILPSAAASSTSVNIMDSVWDSNTTEEVGAAIFAGTAQANTMQMQITGSRFAGNIANGPEQGGAISWRAHPDGTSQSLTVERSSFRGNSGPTGASIYARAVATSMVNNLFYSNANLVSATVFLDLSGVSGPGMLNAIANTFHDNHSGSDAQPEHLFINLPGVSGSAVRLKGNLFHTPSLSDTAVNCELIFNGTIVFMSRDNMTNRSSCQFDAFDTVDPSLSVLVSATNHPIHILGVFLPQMSPAVDSWAASECTDLTGDPLAADLTGDRRLGGNPMADPLNGNPLTVPGCDPGAFEAPVGRLLDIDFAGAGTGTVDVLPSHTDCTTDCQLVLPDQEDIELSAVADTGSVFIGWMGACSGTAACPLTMTTDLSVTAEFSPVPTFDLNVTVTGTGEGFIISDPAGLSCNGSCTSPFNENALVTLTPSPSDGSEFVGFGGDCSGMSCQILMDGNHAVSAEFAFIGYQLAVDVLGQGSVVSNPGTIDCPGICSDNYAANTQVSLTAMPDAGRTFAYWQTPALVSHQKSGFCTTDPVCEFSMGQSYDIDAVFTNPVSVTLTGSGSGRVQGWNIDCPGNCADDQPADIDVTLTATADPGSLFLGWSGDCSGIMLCQIAGGSGGVVTAEFVDVDVLFEDGFE